MAPRPRALLYAAVNVVFNSRRSPFALHSARQYTTTSQTDNALDVGRASKTPSEDGAPRRSYSESRIGRIPVSWEMMRDKNERQIYREQVIDRIESKMRDVPKPKFREIKKVPISVQDMFEDLASSGIINSGFGIIIDRSEIEKNSQLLMNELNSLAKNGDANAIALLQLVQDVAMGKVTHAHIVEGMPVLNFSGFKPESLRGLAPFVKIDNDTTSKDESYLAALQYAASTAFVYALLNMMSKNQFPVAKHPINCFRTTNPQELYTQKDKSSIEIPTATALVGVYADRTVITYLADADQIVELLTPESLKLGMQKRFYYPVSVFGTEPDASQQFPLISKVGNFYCIRLENGVFVGQDHDGKGHHQYHLLQEELEYMTTWFLENDVITKVPLGTGGFLFKDPHRTAWGRYNGKDGHIKTNDSKETYVTEEGKPRKVMNLSAGIIKKDAPKVRSEVPRSQEVPKPRVENSTGGALQPSDVKMEWGQ